MSSGLPDRTPLGTPLTDPFPATRAAHVLNRTHAADQQLHQLAERRLVIRASALPRRRIEGHRFWNDEENRRTYALDRAGGVPVGDAPHMPQCDWARQDRGK